MPKKDYIHFTDEEVPEEFRNRTPRYFIDIETISRCDLVKHGAARYAEHPSTEITHLCIYDSKKDEEHSWIRHDSDIIQSGVHKLYLIFEDILSGRETYCAHNILFEHFVLDNCLARFVDDLDDFGNESYTNMLMEILDYTSFQSATVTGVCTKDLAKIRGIHTSSLDYVSNCLGFGGKHGINKLFSSGYLGCIFEDSKKLEQKLKTKAGKTIISDFFEDSGYLIKSSDIFFNKDYDGYELWTPSLNDHINEYCMRDVKLCYKIYQELHLRPNDKTHGDMWQMYRWMEQFTRSGNIRGVRVDMRAVDALIKAGDQYKKLTTQVVNSKFGGLNPTQVKKLAIFLKPLLAKHKIKTEGVGKKALYTYLILLKDKDPELTELIETLLISTTNVYNKAHKVKDMMCKDGSVKGMMSFCGASTTGRSSSLGVQLQNCPRPALKLEEMRAAVEVIENDGQEMDDIEWLKSAIISLVRPMFIPRGGYKFFSSDLSQIELRNSLFHVEMFEELEILHAKDLYSEFAEKIFNIVGIKKPSPERDVAKETVLSSTYDAKGATVESSIIKKTGKLPMIPGDKLVEAFHARFPGYRKYYMKYQEMITKAMSTTKRIKITLNSGRILRFNDIANRVINTASYIYRGPSYMNFGRAKKLKKGGVLNNIIQGESADILRVKEVYFLFKTHGVCFFLFDIHDQILVEVPIKKVNNNLESTWLSAGDKFISERWPGMPLDSDSGFSDVFYK